MIGAQLRTAAEASRTVLFNRLRAAGFDDLRDSHFALFKFPGPHGMRPTELAEHVGLSKQALNPLLNDLEMAGYLQRSPNGADGRHRVLLLTERGAAFLAEAERILEGIEQRLAVELGGKRYEAFCDVLRDLPALLEIDRSLSPMVSRRKY